MLNILRTDKPILKLFFWLNVIIGAYWLLATTTNVYYFILTGVIFEMSAIIMVAALYALPIANLVMLIAKKEHRKTMALFLVYSIVIGLLLFFNKELF